MSYVKKKTPVGLSIRISFFLNDLYIDNNVSKSVHQKKTNKQTNKKKN